MFTLPVLGAMIPPNIPVFEVLLAFVPLCLAHVFRPICLLVMGLRPFWPVLVCPLLLVRALLVPLLRRVRPVPVRVLLRR
jgi:hypothetical protein